MLDPLAVETEPICTGGAKGVSLIAFSLKRTTTRIYYLSVAHGLGGRVVAG